MIRSMTGFGRGESQGDGKTFIVEIKTVNHRYSDVFVKMPRNISFLEDKIRELVSKSVSRGKIDVYISFEEFGEDSKTVVLDEALAKAYLNTLMQARDKFGLKDDLSISLLTRLPDVLKVEKAEEDEGKIWGLLKVSLEKALQSLVTMRENEGQELKNSLFDRSEYIENVLKNIVERAPEVIKEYKHKLETRLNDILEQKTIDENRFAMEVAIFADRCSIDEEIVRLGSHLGQLREALQLQQPVGRKLDFLVQEMNREINTIGSKANDLVITRNVVEIKSEIEKIREQIQNVE